MSGKVDLLGQYISQVLIPRLNRADELVDQGRYFDAVQKQLSVIRVLYRRKQEDKDNLKSWIKRIDDISDRSKNITGETEYIRGFNKGSFKNLKAKSIYREIDMEIWDKLHAFGYFDGRKAYGPDLNLIDMEKAEEL